MIKKRSILLRLVFSIALAVIFMHTASADECCAVSAPSPGDRPALCNPGNIQADSCCPDDPTNQEWSYGEYGFPQDKEDCLENYFAQGLDNCVYDEQDNPEAPKFCELVCCCSDGSSNMNMWKSECAQEQNPRYYPYGECPAECGEITQCNDGIDNDADGLVDEEDPGCWSDPLDSTTYFENDTREENPQCYDELDNDGDGLTDWPDDPGCVSAADDDERGPQEQCSPAGCHQSTPPRFCDGSFWTYNCDCCPPNTECITQGYVMVCQEQEQDLCQNGDLDEGEDCDGGQYRLSQCSDIDPSLTGELACYENCTYNLEQCTSIQEGGCVPESKPYEWHMGALRENCSQCGCPASAVEGPYGYNYAGFKGCKEDGTCNYCGNGVVEYQNDEFCDPAAQQRLCSSFDGFGPGEHEYVACTNKCTLDMSPCARTCVVDGYISEKEDCDDNAQESDEACKEQLYGECTANVDCDFCSCSGDLDCSICEGSPDYQEYCQGCIIGSQCVADDICLLACLYNPNCNDPDCNCEDCGCSTDCSNRECCEELDCPNSACSDISEENICYDNEDNDGDQGSNAGGVDCEDIDCSSDKCRYDSQVSGTCYFPYAIDTDNDGAPDTCCYNGRGQNCASGQVCGNCPCESNPQDIVLTLESVVNVFGEKSFELEWSSTCTLDTFHIYRCSADSPEGCAETDYARIPLDIEGETTSYIDEFDTGGGSFYPNRYYCYKVKGYLGLDEINSNNDAICVYSGDDACFQSSVESEYYRFCIKNETTDSVYRCHQNNTLKEVWDCDGESPARTCIDYQNGEATCEYQSPCDECNGILGMFANPNKQVAYDQADGGTLMADCRDLPTCFLDRSVFFHSANAGADSNPRYSNVDMYRSCSGINRCSDYKSKQACEQSGEFSAYNNPCRPYNCTWYSTNMWDLSQGVCAPQEPDNEDCAPCDDTGLIPCDDWYCQLTNCAPNGNQNGCVETAKKTCESYLQDKDDCLGVQGENSSVNVVWGDSIKIGGDNKRTQSNDKYGIGTCKFGKKISSLNIEQCFKDADDDGVWDGDEYNWDSTPPSTAVSFVMPYKVIDFKVKVWENFRVRVSVKDEDENGGAGSGLAKIRMCVSPAPHACYPGNPNDNYKDYELSSSSGYIDFASSDFESFEGDKNYNLYYFSEDNARNLEQVNVIPFLYSHSVQSRFDVTYEVIPDPLQSGNSQVVIDVDSDDLLTECNANLTGNGEEFSPSQGMPEPESGQSEFSLQYIGLSDGSYIHRVSCKDPYDNTLTNTINPIRVNANGITYGEQPEGIIDFTEFNLSLIAKENGECKYALFDFSNNALGAFESFESLISLGNSEYLHTTRLDLIDYLEELNVKHGTTSSYLSDLSQLYNFYYACDFDNGEHRESNIVFGLDLKRPDVKVLSYPFNNPINWSLWYNEETGILVTFDAKDYPQNDGFGLNASASKYCAWANREACVPETLMPQGQAVFYTTQNLCVKAQENKEYHDVYSPELGRLLGGKAHEFCEIFKIDSVAPRIFIPPQLAVVGPSEQQSSVQGRILDVAYFEEDAHTINRSKNFTVFYGKSDSQRYGGTKPYKFSDFTFVSSLQDIYFGSVGRILFKFRSSEQGYYAASIDYEGADTLKFRLVRDTGSGAYTLGSASATFTRAELEQSEQNILEIRAEGQAMWASLAGRTISASHSGLKSGAIQVATIEGGSVGISDTYVIDHFKEVDNYYEMSKVGSADQRIGHTLEDFSEGFELDEGVNRFRIMVKDIANNDAEYEFNITKDNVGPEIFPKIFGESIDYQIIRVDNDTHDAPSAELNHPLYFEVKARDDHWSKNVTRVSLRLKCITCTPNVITGPIELERQGFDNFTLVLSENLAPGEYIATYQAWDKFQNSKKYEQTFQISDSIPPALDVEIRYQGEIVNRTTRAEPRRIYQVIISSNETLSDINATFFLEGLESESIRSIANIGYVPGSSFSYSGVMEIPFGHDGVDHYDVDDTPAILRVRARDKNYAQGQIEQGFIVDTQCTEGLYFYQNQDWWQSQPAPYVTTEPRLGVYGETAPDYKVTLASSLDNESWSTAYASSAAGENTCSSDEKSPMQGYSEGDSTIEITGTTSAYNPGEYLSVKDKPTHRATNEYYRITTKQSSTPVSTSISITPPLEKDLQSNAVLRSCQNGVPSGWFGTTLMLQEGELKLRGVAEDDIGNICSEYSPVYTIISDFNPPEIFPIAPNDGDLIGKNDTNITLFAKDELSGIIESSIKFRIYRDGELIDSSTCGRRLSCTPESGKGYSISYDPQSDLADGLYTVNVTMNDAAQWSASRIYSFEIDQSLPTISSMEVLPGFSWPDGWHTSQSRPQVQIKYDCQSPDHMDVQTTSQYGVFRKVEALANSQYKVTLSIRLTPGARFYVLEDVPQTPVTVVDAGVFTVDANNHFKHVVFQNAIDEDLEFIVEAPSEPEFAGTYSFEGMTSEASITSESLGSAQDIPSGESAGSIEVTGIQMLTSMIVPSVDYNGDCAISLSFPEFLAENTLHKFRISTRQKIIKNGQEMWSESASEQKSFNIDTNTPTIQANDIPVTNDESLSLKGNFSDQPDNMGYIQVQSDNLVTPRNLTMLSSGTFSEVIELDYAGSTSVTISAVDKAGNKGSVTKTVDYDITRPVLSGVSVYTEYMFENPANGQILINNQSIIVRGRVNEPSTVYANVTNLDDDPIPGAYYDSSSTGSDTDGSFELILTLRTIDDYSSHMLKVVAVDNAGNPSAAYEVGLTYDDRGPTVEFVEPPKPKYADGRDQPHFTNDDTPTLRFRTNVPSRCTIDTQTIVADMPAAQGGLVHSYSYPQGVPRQEDVEYQFTVSCYSQALQAEGSLSSSFVVDKTPPVLAFKAKSDNTEENSTEFMQIFEVVDNYQGELQSYLSVFDQYSTPAFDNDLICESYTCSAVPDNLLCNAMSPWGNGSHPLSEQSERLIFTSTDYNEYTYLVSCKDRAGNPAQAQAILRVDVHRNFDASSIVPKYTSDSQPTVTVRTNMAAEYCEFTYNTQKIKKVPESTDLQSISYEFDEPLADGAHTLTIVCRPYNAYAQDLRLTWSVFVDTQPPQVKNASVEREADGLIISWNAEDESPSSGIANYSYKVDQNSASSVPSQSNTVQSRAALDLDDGEYYLHVKAQDRASNWGNTLHFPFSIDTAGPQRVELSVSPNPAPSQSTAVVQGRVYKTENQPDSGAKVDVFAESIYKDTVIARSDGIFAYNFSVGSSSKTVKAVAVDALGNGPTNASTYLKVISSGPRFSHMMPAEGSITPSVSAVSVVLSRVDDAQIDLDSLDLSLSGQDAGGIEGSVEADFTDNTLEQAEIVFYPASQLADDTYTLTVQAGDVIGNTEMYTRQFTVSADALSLTLNPPYDAPVFRTSPELTLDGELSGQAAAQSAKLIIDNNDEHEEISLILNSQSFSVPITLAEQENRLEFRFIDENGGISSSGYLYYIYDRRPPILEITRPQNGLLTHLKSTTMFEGIAGAYQEHYFTYNSDERIDSMQSLRVFRNQQEAGYIESPFENQFLFDLDLSEGLNRIEVQGEDKAGLKGSAFVNITLDTSAPEISITQVRVDPEFIKYEDQGVIRTNAERLIISGTYSDDNMDKIVLEHSSEQAVLDGQGAFQINVSIQPHQSVKNLTLKASDKTGHVSSVTLPYIVDQEGPQVVQIHPEFTKSQMPALYLSMDERTSDCSATYESELGLEFTQEATSESDRNMTLQISQTLADNSATDLNLQCTDPLGNQRTTIKPVTVDNQKPAILDLTIAEGGADLENSSSGMNEYVVYSGGMLDGRRVAVVKLKAEADEPVKCRYSKMSVRYENMESLFDGYYDYMLAPMTDNIILEDNSTTIIHASCEDRAGNLAGNYFSVKIKVNLDRSVHIMEPRPEGFASGTDVELSLETMPEADCTIERALFNGRVDESYEGVAFEEPTAIEQTATGKQVYKTTLPLSLAVGEWDFEVICTDPEDVFMDAEETISFNLVPPFSLDLVSPRHGWSSTQVFDIHMQSSRSAKCRYDIESAPFKYLYNNLSTEDGLNHYIYDQGQGIMYVSCVDSFGYEMPTKRYAFNFDPTAPDITQAYAHPNPVNFLIDNTLQTTMYLHTDDGTVCRYSAQTQDYDQMQEYFEGNDVQDEDSFDNRHQVTLRDLDDRVTYTYYVACENRGGQVSDTKTIRFETDRTADLSVSILEPRNGLVTRENSVKLRAITNKPAECFYGNETEPATPFSDTGYTNHSTGTLSNFDEGGHTIYVRCATEVYSAESSTSFVVDMSPPIISNINDSYNTCYLTWLKASWSGEDDTHEDTYVERYYYAIGTSKGASDIVNWTDAGDDTVVSRSGLDLEDGETYYWSVIAMNNAGRNSTKSMSSGVTMDTSTCPVEGEPDCYDGRQNGLETGVDCGGPCSAKCPIGEGCDNDEDCISGYCDDEDVSNRVCEAALCENGKIDEDNAETDVDCGGDTCEACENTKACEINGDCQSSWCDDGQCKEASCTDGIKNGAESSIDCGGQCEACELGDDCNEHSDCLSLVCSLDGECVEPSCNDGLQTDGFDTDYDCGGECPPCEQGQRCNEDADCVSGNCDLGYCEEGGLVGFQIVDEDNDDMDDNWEIANGLDPTRNDASEDPDGDKLTNLEESELNTDPQVSDTDGDSHIDGEEVNLGYDPLDPSSYPGSEDGGGSIWYIILLVVLILALLGGGGYYGYMEYQKRYGPKPLPGMPRMQRPSQNQRRPAVLPQQRGPTPQQARAEQEKQRLMQKALEERKKMKQESRFKAFEAFEGPKESKDAQGKSKVQGEIKKKSEQQVIQSNKKMPKQDSSQKKDESAKGLEWIPLKIDNAKLEKSKGHAKSDDALSRLEQLSAQGSALKKRDVFSELDKLTKPKKDEDVFQKLSSAIKKEDKKVKPKKADLKQDQYKSKQRNQGEAAAKADSNPKDEQKPRHAGKDKK